MPICEECGAEHSIEDLELSFKRPDQVACLSPEERSRSVQENRDLCVLNGQRFFIRAHLPLPVHGRSSPYNLGVWVEVEQPSFERVYELWDEPNQSQEPAFLAALANDIPLLPSTLGLGAKLRLTGPTTRPRVHLSQAAHALVAEQTHGISVHRAHEYSSVLAKGAA